MVRLELLYSARNHTEFSEIRDELGALHDCPVGSDQFARALWVYGKLAEQGGGHQRAVKHPDLLIAAAAEAAGLPVLHYDDDYVRIARITGQPVFGSRRRATFADHSVTRARGLRRALGRLG